MSVDWTIFDGLSECTVSCNCGREYRSHTKIFYENLGKEKVRQKQSQQPCPGCGRDDDWWKTSSDPEMMEIRR